MCSITTLSSGEGASSSEGSLMAKEAFAFDYRFKGEFQSFVALPMAIQVSITVFVLCVTMIQLTSVGGSEDCTARRGN